MKNHSGIQNLVPGAGRGGRREGAGRKTNAFKDKCAALANSPKFFAWAKGVIDGTISDFRVDKLGIIRRVPVTVYDRKELWKDVAAYGHGKPDQIVSLSNSEGVPFAISYELANPSGKGH